MNLYIPLHVQYLFQRSAMAITPEFPHQYRKVITSELYFLYALIIFTRVDLTIFSENILER